MGERPSWGSDMCGNGTENCGVTIGFIRGETLLVGEKNPSVVKVLRKLDGEKGICEFGEGD